MIFIGQPLTAGHVCFHEKWWFGSLGSSTFIYREGVDKVRVRYGLIVRPRADRVLTVVCLYTNNTTVPYVL